MHNGRQPCDLDQSSQHRPRVLSVSEHVGGHMSVQVHKQTCGKGGNREEDLERGAWLLGPAECACVEALASVCSAVFAFA